MLRPFFLLFFVTFFGFVSNSQRDYNKNCLVIEAMMGNGVYGIFAGKIGGEFRFQKNQKLGINIGFGSDISWKFGSGIAFSPYEWNMIDLLISLDYTRMFGSTYVYHNETGPDDVYSFDNTNLLIPSATIRLIAIPKASFQLTFGWAIGTTNPNIQLVSGNNDDINQKNIGNRLVGGYRFAFGGSFRIRKWDKPPAKIQDK